MRGILLQAILLLYPAYIGHDPGKLRVGYTGNRRHCTKLPVMRCSASFSGAIKRCVTMVSSEVETVYQRWPLVAAARPLTVATGAIFLVQAFPQPMGKWHLQISFYFRARGQAPK